jgi:cytochrome oxidase Cu insertion factor (SCO1/SenC/PrrC family)
VLWVTSTLLWWTFAFTPLPSAPPPWLTAARAACFGTMQSGLPAAQGWMLLVLAPASFLVAIIALWGAELWASLHHAARTPLGGSIFAVMALLVMAESAWVARKIHAAGAVTTWAQGAPDDRALPARYPRQATAAPDFALVDQHGSTISLASFRGRPVVLTFVFAHCQTMCPLIVDAIKRAAPEARPSEVLLVTLDPWRDTPSSLPGLAGRWAMPERFHVLSSRNAQDVVDVIETYGVPFERDDRSGDITHPGLVFLVDAEGRLAYTFNNPPSAWIREGLLRLDGAHAPLQ